MIKEKKTEIKKLKIKMSEIREEKKPQWQEKIKQKRQKCAGKIEMSENPLKKKSELKNSTTKKLERQKSNGEKNQNDGRKKTTSEMQDKNCCIFKKINNKNFRMNKIGKKNLECEKKEKILNDTKSTEKQFRMKKINLKKLRTPKNIRKKF